MATFSENALRSYTTFDKDLSAPDPLPAQSIEAAVNLMRDGRLFRYGEDRDSLPEATLLEEEFAAMVGVKYCVGVNSGGCALFVALRSAGVKPGTPVLTNAFTLAPVPGAIAHAGGRVILVDITDRLTIDLDDLARKAKTSGARYVLLSFMRGHLPNMDELMAVCRENKLLVIEDCAHTMGADWAGQPSGTFGLVGCFSTQTFKHINSGEGGLVVTNDDDIAAQAVLLSGSYMLYGQHRACPAMEVFERHKWTMPNCSMRMSSLVASVLRPQLALLAERNRRWREIYRTLANNLDGIDHLRLPERPEAEGFVPTSLQFTVEGLDEIGIERFVCSAGERGVHIKWFGAKEPIGFTSRHDHWRYLENIDPVPNADRVLKKLCDLRLPLWLTSEDCRVIAQVLREAMADARN